MEFRILGPLEVLDGERPVALGGSKQRALLALLLLRANRVVSRDRLIDELWDTTPPETARTALQVHVSQLRKALGHDVIVTRAPGYAIQVEPDELDSERFERLVESAQGQPPAEAAESLREALALWRGPPLNDLDGAFAQAERGQLEEQHSAALEQRVEADLELGRHAQLVPELEALVRADPLRERRRAQLMLALYRCGRQAEALEAYQQGRRLLADELGLEPGDQLRRLEKAILEQDPALALDERSLPPVERESVPDDSRRRLPVLALAFGALLLAGALATVLVLVLAGDPAIPVRANSVAAIDPKTGRVLADVPIGGRPIAIAVGAGAVWVANADQQTISRIDPKSKRVVQTIGGLGPEVSDIAFGFGSLWVAGGNDGTLLRIDPHLNAVLPPIDLGGRSEPVPQAVFLVATGEGNVWITRGNRVLRIDPETNSVTGTHPVSRPGGLAAGAGSVWVTKEDEHVLRLDPASVRPTADQDMGGQVFFPLVYRNALWMLSERQTEQVWRVDPSTITETASIAFPKSFLLDLAGGYGAIWTVDHDNGVLLRVDPGTEKGTRVAEVGKHPISVAAGEGLVWIGVQEEPFT